jgi:hypothetical protein
MIQLAPPLVKQHQAKSMKEATMRGIRAVLERLASCLVLLTGGFLQAGDGPDLSRVDRHIVKEPPYRAKEPLYGLYVFGPEAKTRAWAVFDKSKPDAAEYDVLYFDRNANGDLTDSGERIEGKVAPEGVTFDIGTFTDPATGQKHTEVSITRHSQPHPMVMLRMKWCDKVMVKGGYASDVGPYTEFAPTPAAAPVLWPGADGPLGFQFWQLSPLPVGQATDVRVFLGHQGQGRNTFCAVPDTFLPKEILVLATLIYTDQAGKEQRARSELRERC